MTTYNLLVRAFIYRGSRLTFPGVLFSYSKGCFAAKRGTYIGGIGYLYKWGGVLI